MNYFTWHAKVIRTFTVFLILYSCNNPVKNVVTIVDSQVNKSNIETNDEIELAKAKFGALYNLALNRTVIIENKKNLQYLNATITQTAIFLDSLKKVLLQLDDKDVNNIKIIKIKFVENYVGDSIFNKLKSSIVIAEDVATMQKSKDIIKNVGDSVLYTSNIHEWKEQLFGLTGPLAASMIIYGLQSELYKIGLESLSDY